MGCHSSSSFQTDCAPLTLQKMMMTRKIVMGYEVSGMLNMMPTDNDAVFFFSLLLLLLHHQYEKVMSKLMLMMLAAGLDEVYYGWFESSLL